MQQEPTLPMYTKRQTGKNSYQVLKWGWAIVADNLSDVKAIDMVRDLNKKHSTEVS